MNDEEIIKTSSIKGLVDELLNYADMLEKCGKAKLSAQVFQLAFIAPENAITSECKHLCKNWMATGRCEHDSGNYNLFNWIKTLQKRKEHLAAQGMMIDE